MTDRVQAFLEILKAGDYKKNRSDKKIDIGEKIAGKSKMMTCAIRFCETLKNEKPYLLPGERIGFNRSNTYLTTYFDENGEEPSIWGAGNTVPDYERMLNLGMDVLREEILEKMKECRSEQKEFYETALLSLDAALEFADRCRHDAKEAGATELYEALGRVPHGKAETLLDACVFIKFMTFTLRCNSNTHITLGRFDKYMRPFYYHDLKNGKNREELLELLEEFFISMNFDTDLYPGVQLGDNGQSLVLGGCDENGAETFDDFSHMCMEASLELALIDPKINLRVNKNTPIELYEYATQLTKQGLGFPQYCNDDVVIPGLIKLGYAPEDAADYAVAACWEFIIPGKGMDVPNLSEMNFPKVVEAVVHRELLHCGSFEELMEKTKQEIKDECERCITLMNQRHELEAPYLSLFIHGCIESGKDISEGGAIYNNYGLHGPGISVAADSLAAIREVIYEKAEYTKETLLDALNKNYEGYESLRNRLLSCPKMGNNDDTVDDLAIVLMDTFASYWKGKKNRFGGFYRAGTGSAQGYIFYGETVGATPDGRKAKEPFGANYSPALTSKIAGPFSCIQSFTKYDLSKIINGGPLTLEIHDTTFRNEEGIKKVAQLVKIFIELGGHQLQLNAINRERLLDAIEHPENHKNLIVRVWGWSGYFVELDSVFQEHVLKRAEYQI